MVGPLSGAIIAQMFCRRVTLSEREADPLQRSDHITGLVRLLSLWLVRSTAALPREL